MKLAYIGLQNIREFNTLRLLCAALLGAILTRQASFLLCPQLCPLLRFSGCHFGPRLITALVCAHLVPAAQPHMTGIMCFPVCSAQANVSGQKRPPVMLYEDAICKHRAGGHNDEAAAISRRLGK